MEATGCSAAEPFALRVLGDMMEPEFEHGCVIVIDPEGAVSVNDEVLDTDVNSRRVPILSDDCGDWNDPVATWEGWFEAVGLPPAEARRSIHFGENVDQALDAAIAGLGVVLGHRVMASHDIARGRLACPFGPEIGTGLRYQVVCRKRRRIPANVARVRDWLVEELGRSTTFRRSDGQPATS